MSIKSDRWIARMAREHGMIEPFEPGQVRVDGSGKIVSYGVSSYGYDVRCADEFKIFTNINTTIVDPKHFDSKSFVDFKGDCCIIPPNSFALARTVEYFRIPRDVLVVTLGKSTYARCFSGDTRVALVDRTAPTLEEMARRYDSGERHWGYSIGPSGSVIVTLLDAPRFIGRGSLIEVALDHGAAVRATPEHLFLRRDGRMVEAAALRPGDSLMPLHRQSRRGCEMVYQPVDGHLYPTHRLADEWRLRHRSCSDAPGTRRQHRDRNRRDDRPTNGQHMPAARPGETLAETLRGLETNVSQRSHGAANKQASAALPGAPRWGAEWSQGVDARRHLRAERRNHKVAQVRELPGEHDVFCLTVPEAGNFALEAGVFVRNCGVIVNVTPLEPEWEGHVTLEFSNTTPLPAKIYANEGIAQMLFLEADEICQVSYKDRDGKYMGQRGVTLPKT